MPRDQLDGALEDNILTLLCWSDQHASTVAMKVPPDLFSTRAFQEIAVVAVDYLARYQRPPRAHLRDLLEEKLDRGDEGRFLARVVDAMDRLHEELQPDYVLSQLDRFISIRRLTQTINRAADSLHSGDLEAAQEALSDLEPRRDEHPQAFLDDPDAWLRFLDQDEELETFSSGIDILDERGVRPKRAGLMTVLGPSGVGKSTWLRQLAKHNILLHRKKVLHVTLENDFEDTLQDYTMTILGRSKEEIANLRVPIFRRDSLGRFVSLDYSQITPESISLGKRAIIRKRLEMLTRRAGRLLVKWFPTNTLTMGGLINYLDMLARTEDFKPDMVVLDSAYLMYVDPRDPRIALGTLFKNLRGLAGQRDLAMVTGHQGNRISSSAKVVSGNMVAEDWSIHGTSDVFVTINRTLDEREAGLARILVDKARRQRDKWLALITQSYATGQFCLDSVYFNKLAQDEVARVTGKEDEE